jgi:hypothetical protein
LRYPKKFAENDYVAVIVYSENKQSAVKAREEIKGSIYI